MKYLEDYFEFWNEQSNSGRQLHRCLYSRYNILITFIFHSSLHFQIHVTMGPSQPTVHWLPGLLLWGVKRPGSEAEHLSLASVQVKKTWIYTSTPQYVLMAQCLFKQRDSFTLPHFQNLFKKFVPWWLSFLMVRIGRNMKRQTELRPGVYSASNRNEYQKQKNNVSGEYSAVGA
jgi:hypothetical protein